MTLRQFRDYLVTVDPAAQHYETTSPDQNYTVWQELRRLAAFGDGERFTGWEIAVDRYTDTEFDPVAEALEEAFQDRPEIFTRYAVSYDIGRHRIHHSFTLQVM